MGEEIKSPEDLQDEVDALFDKSDTSAHEILERIRKLAVSQVVKTSNQS